MTRTARLVDALLHQGDGINVFLLLVGAVCAAATVGCAVYGEDHMVQSFAMVTGVVCWMHWYGLYVNLRFALDYDDSGDEPPPGKTKRPRISKPALRLVSSSSAPAGNSTGSKKRIAA